MDGTVEFSAAKIEILNDYEALTDSCEKPFTKECTYFVQNRCSTSKNVRVSIQKDSDPAFHLLHGSEEQYLAAGLRLPVILCYRPTELAIHNGKLEIYVDDVFYRSVVIEAYPPSACLQVKPLVVNFGTVVCECQLASQTFSISNSGTKEGHFQLVTASLPENLKIDPTEGTIRSGQTIMLNVELLCKVHGNFSEDVRILLDDSIISVTLKANRVPRTLELLDVSGSKIMNMIAFGKTYYGTVLKMKVVLHNKCPASTNYLVLLDENAVGNEKGVDMSEGLAMACNRGGLAQTRWKEQGFSSEIDSLIQVYPSQGLLAAYEKHSVELTFTPQFTISEVGWAQFQDVPTQRDYVLFLKFVPICSGVKGAALEVAVTGTACPVHLDIYPDKSITFGDCPLGTVLKKDIKVCNKSNILPVKFRCQQPAHYKCLPSAGKISPGKAMDITIVFQPRQMGPLNCRLSIDVFEINSAESKAKTRNEVVCSTVLDLKGTGRSGLTINEHRAVEFAHPNVQATSIRPHDGTVTVITPHTKVKRHTYVDPDYSFSSKELAARKHHQAMYTSYITRRHVRRKWQKREKALTGHGYQNATDMSIQPAQGLRPPSLKVPGVSDTAKTSKCESRLITNGKLKTAISEQLSYVEKCPTKPLSSFIESECKSVLTPKQLSLIVIEPCVLDYGCVVINSTSKKTVIIKNFTNLHTAFKFKLSASEVYCKDYGDLSTVQVFLAPRSYTQFCFALEHKSLGRIEGSVEYAVNGHHNYHLSVRTEVTLLSLSLSTDTLILAEPYLATHTAGLRGSVAIINKHKVPLAFQWHAREGVDTEVFNMMHPTGVISAGTTLMCEFICQPSFDCPTCAQFLLDVTTIENYMDTSGPTSKIVAQIQPSILKLVTQFHKPVCAFRERRVLFGTVPLFVTSTQNVHIENLGDCHAYFKVSDGSPHPGMHVHPVCGCIPVGGVAELTVLFQPNMVGPFDVKLNVLLKEGKSITLRIAGNVDQPVVSIDQDMFDFGGVYCGSRVNLPFTVSNKTATNAQLSFDFSHLPDFSLVCTSQIKSKITKPSGNDAAQLKTLDLAPNSETQCKLQFCPKEVAAYDVYLPVLVNGIKPTVPPPLPWPPSQTNSSLTLLKGVQPSFSMTPMRRILATALRPPLLLSHSELNFSIPPAFFDGVPVPVQHQKAIVLRNVSDKLLNWGLDCSESQRVMDGTFRIVLPGGSQFSPPIVKGSVPSSASSHNGSLLPGEEFSFMVLCCPADHGTFTASIPLILNCDDFRPYRILKLSATLPSGTFTIDPPHVIVQPVPLGLCVNAQFTVAVEGFLKPVQLEAILPTVESCVHFDMRIPDDMSSVECSTKKKEILCFLEFSSFQPVSISDYVIFTDRNSGKRKRVPFSVCADNTIFTVYEFFAQNVNSASVYLNEMNTPILQLHETRKQQDDSSCSSTSCVVADTVPSFSTSPTFADIFLQDTIASLCRWVSAHGWSQGIKTLVSPIDLSVPVKDELQKPGEKQRSSVIQSRGPLLDMLIHFCGQLPPGIPVNPPPCSTTAEKINLLFSTYNIVIEFLRSHGGMMWNVVPEALLDYQSYLQWTRDITGSTPAHFVPENEGEFDEMSKQAWTHVLMQIIKVVVLRQVTKYIPPYLRNEIGSFSPLSSNFYSIPERVLLSWVNYHYDQLCNKLFHRKGIDVVNFEVDFMDSSVLACLLSSYCPFLIESYFQRLYAEPASPEECSHNAIILVDAMKHAGLEYDILPNDICSPNPLSMILFCAFLYQRLRFYKPTRILTFETVLNSPVKQQINLENPTVKPLKYRILVRGSNTNDFVIHQTDGSVTIGGRKNKILSISYSGRSLCASFAVLLLVATGNKTTSGKILSFSLSGVVTGAKPQCVTAIEASLYQPQTIPIDFTEPGTQGGMFNIRLCESGDLSDSMKSDPNFNLKQRSGQPFYIPSSALQQRSSDGIQLFNIATKQQEILLHSNSSTPLVLNFVPLKMEPRHCVVILSNKDFSDIVLYIDVSVKNPRPIAPQAKFLHPGTTVNKETSTVYLKSLTGEVVEEEIIIHSSNTALENAALELSKAEMTTKEIKRRLLTESLHYAALSTAVAALQLNPMVAGSQQEEDDKLIFTVKTSDSVHYSLPKEISIPADHTGFGVLPVKFCSAEEGQYECHVVLESHHDIRIVIIESTVMARGRQAQLEFDTQAMQPVIQDIPIVNPSSADWPLVASISGNGFVGPDSIIARALTTTYYQLQFSPVQEGTVEGLLSLKNSIDSSEHVFVLKGVATRPLAQDHVRLKAQVKQSMSHIIHVPNIQDRTAVFAVESDVNFISGPSTVTIGGNDIIDYPLTVFPKQSGTFSGALVFIAKAYSKPQSFTETLEVPDHTRQEDPYHMWFHVQCTVDPAPPDQVLTISCNIFSSKTLQLGLTNSISDPLILQVFVEGHGISGNDCLCIKPNGKESYSLTYSPIRTGEYIGRIVFSGSPEGEIWYKLLLIAEDPKHEVLPELQCELGRTCYQSIMLNNCLDESVEFTCNNVNTKHFTVTGLAEKKVTVEPNNSVDIPILFSPSTIGSDGHSTEVVFSSKQFGTQVFNLHGVGLPPSSMELITISANLSSSSMHVINFTNPFDVQVPFAFSLKGKDVDHFFLLLKHPQLVNFQPKAAIDIPIMFSPESMYKHQVTVVITAEGNKHSTGSPCFLSWEYPVIGLPQFRPYPEKIAPRIQCCVKERIEEILQVALVNSTSSYVATIHPINTADRYSSDLHLEGCDEEAFSYKLICQNSKYGSLVEHSTGIRLLARGMIEHEDIEAVQSLEFVIVFAPPKAFSCFCELQVSSSHGGVWFFPVHFSANESAPDDIITIQAEGLHKEAKVGFRLTSMSEHPIMFTAQLLSGSDKEITVSPNSGELTPVNTKGTLFCVTYKPTTYGRNHHAKLVVQSETHEWFYKIVGELPKYTPPCHVVAKIQHTSSPRYGYKQ